VDRVMAQSAVVGHLDRRAADLYLEEAYESWARSMTRAVAGNAFLERRLREWTLLRAIVLGLPWLQDDLTSASDWLQLKVAASASEHALTVLSAYGRTRRIRIEVQRNPRRPGNAENTPSSLLPHPLPGCPQDPRGGAATDAPLAR
jgi:hypothetical protein